jgi:hypothetical protein
VTTLTTTPASTPRSRAIVGKATLAMVPSSTNKAVPKEIATIAQSRRGFGKPPSPGSSCVADDDTL